MDHQSSTRWIAALIGVCLFLFALPLAAFGQSDPANFTTVINLPPDVLPNMLAPSTQINLEDGGKIFHVVLETDVELNVVGGSADFLIARSGSTTNINAGAAYQIQAYDGSAVYVRGGFVDDIFQVNHGNGYVELVGGEFRLNGVPVVGASVQAEYGDALSGTLSDGSPFIFSPPQGSEPIWLDATLTNVALTTVDPTPIVVDASNPMGPRSLRAGQSLTLKESGELADNFVAVGATLNIEGGSTGYGMEVSESTVNVSGGIFDYGFAAYRGSVVNVSGGSLGSGIDAHAGSVFNFSGGSTDNLFIAQAGSTVNMSGGSMGSNFWPQSGSVVNISGGSVAGAFSAEPGSDIEFIGGEFALNGETFAGTVASLGPTDVLSGVFADGTPFIFSEFRNLVFGNPLNDKIASVTLTTTTLPTADPAPMVVDASTANVPAGLRAGQSLTVQSGGKLGDNFAVIDAALNVDGGNVGNWADVTGGSVSVSGGTIGYGFSVLQGSVAKISGGKIEGLFNASDGSVVIVTGGEIGSGINTNDGSVFHFSGGEIGQDFQANAGSVVNISGGSFENFFSANSGSVVNISGSSVGNSHSFKADAGSTVNLFGTEFRLDGELIDGLTWNEALTVLDRGETVLSGLLADGSTFSFSLNLTDQNRTRDSFAADALLTITLVSDLAGDYNNDGLVDATDYTVWRNHVGAPAGSLLNDVDGGEIGAAQYATWKSNFGAAVPGGAGSLTPEPATLLLLAAAGLIGLLPRRRGLK